uniref:Myosin IC n=1 Tax=Latimeria chalumnae TaxID=7897 RepID=H3AMX4_LATCH
AVGSDGIRMTMESALTARDRVGVQDFVLLENYQSEAAFIENLRKRFKENLIYTYIGSVLVSVNPYKELEIYSKQHMERYRGVNFYEVSPHIYAIADNSYRAMRTERKDQCILISGESGAGKTEATKKILQYYAVTCPASDKVQTVKDRLLQSNPVLEAFGNAKTLRNDNSSRFGKYMDVQFDFKGAPIGGHILSYLLEKSRVVHQNHGERNFHIFYQLLEGGESDLLRRLGLEKNAQQYQYLIKGQCAKVSSINDKNEWKTVKKALSVINFSESDVEELLSIVASVLHLGNIQFVVNDQGDSQLTSENQIRYLATLLRVEGASLREALTHKAIIAKGEELKTPLNLEQAAYARDALAKAVYGRTFSWLVNKINESLAYKESLGLGKRTDSVLGLLDIYGFEVFQHNSFEQFCINYCNEKLQQLFIELTLKSEQEEYEAEGIAWESVQYFNNKIICDLVEEKFKGIISILDEECLRPGDATDLTFLEKLEESIKNHPHFLTHKLADQKTRKTFGREDFRLLHYAGDVNYTVMGKIKSVNFLCVNFLVATLLPKPPSPTRCHPLPQGAAAQPHTLPSSTAGCSRPTLHIAKAGPPSPTRCLPPSKAGPPSPTRDFLYFQNVDWGGGMAESQDVSYGFSKTRRYKLFSIRYKSLCPDTWPNWNGRLADGVATLVRYLGYKPEEYKLGRTKIFIRFPKTLFATEDALELRKQSIATKLQAVWRGFHQKQKFQTMKRSATQIQAWWRGELGRRKAAKRKQAAETIRRFIKGFIYRHAPRCPENEYFLDYVRYSFLMNLKRNLPKNILDKSWPIPPPALTEASEQLRQLCLQNMVWSYCRKISPEWKQQLEQKAVASEVFKDKKDNYPQSVPKLFAATRLETDELNSKVIQALGNEKVKYAVPVTKYDRKGYKARARQLLLTDNSAFIVEEGKVKQRIDYSSLKGISVSSLSDGLFVLHVPCEGSKQKGDVVLQSDHVIETLTKVAMSAERVHNININQGSIKFTVGQGKEGTIDFTSGSELVIAKAKNGHLSVVAPRLNSR